MVRAILYLVISIFLITFVRMVIGLIMRTMKDMMQAQAPHTPHSTPPRAPVAGELRRDPVCGTFVPATSSYQKSLNGATYSFCSAECRDKYAG